MRGIRTAETAQAIVAGHETNFLDEMCAASRSVAFYVGNQAKRAGGVDRGWAAPMPLLWGRPTLMALSGVDQRAARASVGERRAARQAG
jgi:hypothetical protein